jgi:hypothetical protein
MTPQTYKEQDFEEQISKKNYYHIFIEAATQPTSVISLCIQMFRFLKKPLPPYLVSL